MNYKIVTDSGNLLFFHIYDYNYKDPDLKAQFDSEYPNIVVLLKKIGSIFEILEIDLLENPKEILYWGLPTVNLYNTDKILFLGGSRPPSKDETIIYLKKLFPEIRKNFGTEISFY